jgi:predicted nucleic acid-binding protein
VPKSLLDATAYIDFQRARKHRDQVWAINTLRNVAKNIALEGRLGISPPTVMEIVQGLKPPDNLQQFRRDVLPTFEIIPFGEDEACLAGEIYAKLELQRLRIGIPDTQLAAVAITHGLTLITSNFKHFQRVIALGYPLQLENWREA